jgi:hypothetical protein
MRGTTTASLVAAMVLFGATAAAAEEPTSTPDHEVMTFLDHSRSQLTHVEGRPGGPNPADVVRFHDLLRYPDPQDSATRQVLGRMRSTCTLVGGTSAQCEGELQLQDGTVELAGTPDLAGASIDLVVTGGSGRYEGVSGTVRLTPTDVPGVLVLTVILERA